MDEYYYIYFHRNIENGKVFYVGMSLALKGEHARAFDLRAGWRNKKWREVFLLCSKGVSIEIVETFNNLNDCMNREKYWVSYFGMGSKNKGYLTNIGYGGSHKTNTSQLLQYNLDGTFVKEWDSVQEASLNTGYTDKAIYRCLEEQKSTSKCGDYMWVWKNGHVSTQIMPYGNTITLKMKKVYVYKSDNGEFVGSYASVTRASKALGVDCSSLFKCLKGERISAKGYKFSILEKQTDTF